MNDDQLLLIDLSSIAHAIFHVSGNEPDPNFISTKLIERVRGLASQHPHAAICCDAGKSFRCDIDPSYKAHRDTENRGIVRHQIDLACETFARDGFPVWRVPGFEADDLIATATTEALAIDPGVSVLIASDDKDLAQLITDRVTIKKPRDGNTVDKDALFAKFGVTPAQMVDFLCLVGDTSDNIKGAKGIGAVTAGKLLKEHGSLDAIYEKFAHGVVPGITPALRTNLQEFKDRYPTVKQLVTLKTDAPIAFAEIAAERTAPPMEPEPMTGFIEDDQSSHADAPAPTATAPAVDASTLHPSEPNGANSAVTTFPVSGSTTEPKAFATFPVSGGAQSSSVVPYAAPRTPAEFSMQLEPQTPEEAARLAGHLFKSRLFSAYGAWEGILATVLAGRELGIPAMASLRSFHVIEGRPQLSADTIAALVLKSGKAKYFKCTARSATSASFKTLRIGDDEEPIELAYTIDEARKAWKKDERAWNNSSWGTSPADMLVARAKSKLARLVYPDVVGGLYSVEEME